jgi:hypothetical protein
MPVEARFSVPVQTGPGANPASCTMGSGSIPGVKSGRGVTMTPHPLLVPWSRKGRAIPLLPLWAVWPVQSLSACTRVHFTFYPCLIMCRHLHFDCQRYVHFTFIFLCKRLTVPKRINVNPQIVAQTMIRITVQNFVKGK